MGEPPPQDLYEGRVEERKRTEVRKWRRIDKKKCRREKTRRKERRRKKSHAVFLSSHRELRRGKREGES